MQVVVEEDEGGNTIRILLVDKSGIQASPSPVSSSFHDTPDNNTVCQHKQCTLSPVDNGDGDTLKLCSALHKAHSENERLEKVLNEQSLLLQKVTKQLEETKIITEQLINKDNH